MTVTEGGTRADISIDFVLQHRLFESEDGKQQSIFLLQPHYVHEYWTLQLSSLCVCPPAVRLYSVCQSHHNSDGLTRENTASAYVYFHCTSVCELSVRLHRFLPQVSHGPTV